MSDIRHDIDRFINALGRLSELEHIRADKREADQTDRRRCGNCQHWMKKRDCPREQSSMTGYSQGPSSGSPACTKFQLQQWVADLKAKRLAAVEERLRRFEGGAA